MSIIEDIKNEARIKGITITSQENMRLEQLFNRMFYLDKNIDAETEFVRMVMTRGAETQERIGLHASAITKGSDNDFCVRENVLSLLYKQNQRENVAIKLLRIFEEGNAIHEKWQRLFIRAGYADWWDCDRTHYNDNYMISYTPDLKVFIPEICDDDVMIGEIKSMNSWSYQKQALHAEGQKQLMWYLHLDSKKKGFVLADNKDTSEYRIELVDYDEELALPFIKRADSVKLAYHEFLEGESLPKRKHTRTSKKCKQCNVYDACYNTGMKRIPINDEIAEQIKNRG